jgi:hypothetical protein
VFEHWLDDAVEQLQGMEHTCALNVAERSLAPTGLTQQAVADILGGTQKAVHAELRLALIKLRAGRREFGSDGDA